MILILGSNGLLGSYLADYCHRNGHNFLGVNRKEYRYDFLKVNELISLLDTLEFDALVNCVGITSIDLCESDPAFAKDINQLAPAAIAEYCKKHVKKFVHISTDHFYDYGKNYPHKETDRVSLLNEYARTKFYAEKAVLASNRNSLVLRTSMIGLSLNGDSFLDWVIESISANKKINLFDDAFCSFLHADQLSKYILLSIQNDLKGTYNLASSSVFSKYDFVLEICKKLNIKVNLIRSSVKSMQTPRANCCGLDVSKFQKKLSLKMPSLPKIVEHTIKKDSLKNLTI